MLKNLEDLSFSPGAYWFNDPQDQHSIVLLIFIMSQGYLQEVVYKLSKVGQAIDNNDFSTASSILGPNTSTDWIQNANVAFTKVMFPSPIGFLIFFFGLVSWQLFICWNLGLPQLSSSPEEKTEVNTFNTSMASLISSGEQIICKKVIIFFTNLKLKPTSCLCSYQKRRGVF